MSTSTEVIDALYGRLLLLAPEASPEQLAYLAKSIEAVSSQKATQDIISLSDEKLQALVDAAAEHVATIHTAEEVAALQLQEDNTTHLATLAAAKDTHITAIESAGESKLSAIEQASATVSDVPEGSTIMTELNKSLYLRENTAPFLFAILSRNGDGTSGKGRTTTELGQWYKDLTGAEHMLSLVSGCHDHSVNHIGFYTPPQLAFLQGSKGSFVYREMFLRDDSNSAIYLYPYALIGTFFIKNSSNVDITRSFQFGGSNYWQSGYEGAGLFVGVPNETNEAKSSITALSWSNLFSHSTSSSDIGLKLAEVTIPAQKTIALIWYCSSRFYSNPSGQYNNFMHWYVANVREQLLDADITIDIERTLAAYTPIGLSDPVGLWQLF